MLKKAWISFVSKTLHHYFPHPLPPLHHSSKFTLLIAVLLSARATDKKVNEITPMLFKLGKTPFKMAQASLVEVEKIIRPVGFYKTKARAILKLSQLLVEKFQGKVPSTLEELESLPGVGHKTASVVLAQGFHIPAFPVDTHIFRCARRWKLSTKTTVSKVEEDLKQIFPQKEWIKVHLQIIYFARKYCPAKGHIPENCPICSQLS